MYLRLSFSDDASTFTLPQSSRKHIQATYSLLQHLLFVPIVYNLQYYTMKLYKPVFLANSGWQSSDTVQVIVAHSAVMPTCTNPQISICNYSLGNRLSYRMAFAWENLLNTEEPFNPYSAANWLYRMLARAFSADEWNRMIWKISSCRFDFATAPLVERRWKNGTLEDNLALKRLSQTFNVNHFLLSQADSHIAPMLHLKDQANKTLISTLEAEWKHRCVNFYMFICSSARRHYMSTPSASMISSTSSDQQFSLKYHLDQIMTAVCRTKRPSQTQSYSHACWG